VTGLDPSQFGIIVRHNGTVWEDFSSADHIWDTATWIQELSGYTTLDPATCCGWASKARTATWSRAM
jgi:hypothetical protein